MTPDEYAKFLEEKKHRKRMAQDYNNRRAAYKRQVSVLRKQYAEEYARMKKEDDALKAAEQAELTRKRLERQRLKNIRSAQNALRQEELRKEREKEFQQHLEKQQRIRDATNERFQKARQLVVDELELEAPLWLISPEEVEAAFTHEAEQLLWARPGGVLGAPNPSLDAHFWQFETHAQQFRRTFPLMRDVLLEDMEEEAYQEANVDPNFWTPERIAEHERLEQKARLRAMVQSAGRTELLRKQRQLIEMDAAAQEEEGAIRSKAKVPSMKMLNNKRALENEGSELLLRDPTRFFVFDQAGQEDEMDQQQQQQQRYSPGTGPLQGEGEYEGPTLGAPVALRDPVRDNTPDGYPWPRIIGKMERPDTRTEREKKQEEREQSLLDAAKAAADKEKATGGGGVIEQVDLEEDEDTSEDIDYDARPYDSDEEEWMKGLDPEKDADIINVPPARRYTEDDIGWVADQLEDKVGFLEQKLRQEVENMKYELRSEKRAMAQSPEEEDFAQGSLEAAVLNLPEVELMALSDLDEAYTTDMPKEELEAAMKEIPGLSAEQIMELLTRERDEE